MKILHLIYDHVKNPWVGGGAAVRCLELNKRLAARGHEVTIVSGRYPGADDYYDGTLKFRFVGCGCNNYALSTFSYAYRAARYIRAHADDYQLVVEDFAPWNPLMSRYMTHRPVVLQLHHREGSSINRRWPVVGLPFYLIESFYPKGFRNTCAVSRATAQKFGVPRAEVIPNGIDEDLLDVERTQAASDFILYLGRLEIANKGLDTLIEAIRTMKERGRETRLVLAGRGRDEARLREMASGLPVEFAGFVDEREKRRLMGSCLAFVLPSRFEGWGITVMEAAATGAPVVVSAIPELSYAVDGGFGLPFRTGDAGELASVIGSLADEPGLRQRLSENARETARAYTWDRIAVRYEGYLESVVQSVVEGAR
ncbi:MAG: glycosyltransferase family 4 protein [Thermodesulfovibrionales bacterium]|nr:glycosyltransferase family 4 protein [Thermodesulfovibrionales bacterium]